MLGPWLAQLAYKASTRNRGLAGLNHSDAFSMLYRLCGPSAPAATEGPLEELTDDWRQEYQASNLVFKVSLNPLYEPAYVLQKSLLDSAKLMFLRAKLKSKALEKRHTSLQTTRIIHATALHRHMPILHIHTYSSWLTAVDNMLFYIIIAIACRATIMDGRLLALSFQLSQPVYSN